MRKNGKRRNSRPITASEMARKRWSGSTAQERSDQLRRVARARWDAVKALEAESPDPSK